MELQTLMPYFTAVPVEMEPATALTLNSYAVTFIIQIKTQKTTLCPSVFNGVRQGVVSRNTTIHYYNSLFTPSCSVVDMEFSSVIILLSILACTAVGQHHEDATDEFLHSKAPEAAIRYMECMEHGHCSDNSGELKSEFVDINEEVPIERK
ncbi:hypothetical protein TNIN_334591 [Trichonephila inaurata madagascariensis]|uniref:Uncharacterized protein n=1 Tax=Trichonephila inaurata madagascariensis TaxID=2747483 RepID=A0A8X6JP66_9ARAC|nr:hypothetical protein TNIN_334591 [Trichonephila inaurata madagascariensis]